jgi:D-alanyl-lipoteichoic acid acyltransferase DltB (MBOAT superfamily)
VKFNSIEFLIFLPLVALAFYSIPHRWRWILLLGASYLFYASWNPKYIVVLLMITTIGYISGRLLDRETRPTIRRIILTLSLLASLGILFFFKYFELTNRVFHAMLDRLGIVSDIYLVLPLGISYFTFQTLSYILDVYRGGFKAEKHAGIYALFIAFFPQVTAGPIARANLLLPQLHAAQPADYEPIVSGLQRMAWGFFKKLVIADRLAVAVNAVYGDPTAYTGLHLLLATYAFAIQVYCDFSAYADIAIGAARIMGFKLQENFNQPYYAESIPDFWRRWHITLYNWLRDYIFYPLNRALKQSRFAANGILVLVLPPILTMLASGLWHGTAWTFIVWGSLPLPFSLPAQISYSIKVFATFHLVCFTWVFFRANSISDAIYILQHLFVDLGNGVFLAQLMPLGWYDWLISLLAILLMEAVHWEQRRNVSLREVIRLQPAWLRWSLYYAVVVVIFMFGKFGAGEFIYARF